VQSHNALYIFSLEGQVPESKVKVEPTDISPMAEYAWYEWVKFRDTSVNFSESKIHLGRDLGAAIGIGPAMARKVLNVEGKVMYRTSVKSLTPDESQSPSEARARLAFHEAVEKKHGPSMTKDDFKDDPDIADFETPTFEPYEDEKYLLPRCQILMMLMMLTMLTMLTLMINVLALK
jgi:hypothetical protein